MSLSREEIIRMAREAGFNDPDDRSEICLGKAERFAALVAAAEREQCAMVCDERALLSFDNSDEQCEAQDCAAAIRARGDKGINAK